MIIFVWNNDAQLGKELIAEVESWKSALDYCITYADHIKITMDYQGIHIIRVFC